ncbi:hypothetical protein Y032_0074g825 [Ancylostoma ceylanicum]|uniref:Uncharacterized protein n=1 Tax=Ancylostoma ceylanicum TaxID=53326 RepID=A0A016TVK8_9BILA|nr:hypothetical protein Y032_0074g825 [Ancylostoma ceylanicum]
MNFLLVLTIVAFLIATALAMESDYSDKCAAPTGEVAQEGYGGSAPAEESEGYRRRHRMRSRARRLRVKAMKKRLVKKVKKVKKAKKAKKVRRVVKKNKH